MQSSEQNQEVAKELLANRDSGDKPLTDALELMNNEGVSSLPVLDSQNNVIGNISHVDVRVRLSLLKSNDSLVPNARHSSS